MKGLFQAARAAISIALFVGFYLMALSMAAFFLFVAFHERGDRVDWRATIVSVVLAFTILKASLFVPAPVFSPSGERITEAEHPSLFGLIRELARRMKTSMPKEVYLDPNVNAFVTEVGGFMGIGGKRVMGIGLGLFELLDVSQLKAVLAHEFGHYAGGDTRLGGFVYRTRSGIARTVSALKRSWLSKPFELYAALFLWVSLSVSRSQELAADRGAVVIAGKRAQVSSLQRLARGTVIFQSFLDAEVAPLVAGGFCPESLYEGFRRYASERFAEVALAQLDDSLAARKTTDYDTHPSLADRIAHAQSLPDPGGEPDTRPATSLLANLPAVERRMTKLFGNEASAKRLESVAWNDVTVRVYEPALRGEAKRTMKTLRESVIFERTPLGAMQAILAKIVEDDIVVAALYLNSTLNGAPRWRQQEAAPLVVARALGVLLTVQLLDEGGTLSCDIGRPHRVLKDGGVYEPFRIAAAALSDRQNLRAFADRFAPAKGAAQSNWQTTPG